MDRITGSNGKKGELARLIIGKINNDVAGSSNVGIRGLKGDLQFEKVSSAIEKLELKSVMNQPIDTLSKGFKRRVGFAQAILHDPDVLL